MQSLRKQIRNRRSRLGQAMTEYALISVMLLLGGLVAAAPIPGIPGGTSLTTALLKSYQIYYDSFYFTLNMPLP